MNKKLRARLTAKRKLIYLSFIADRRMKEHLLKKGTYERHHIVPRALGGSNDKSNLIHLTREDHLFAHVLLGHIHGGAMWSALWQMLIGGRYLRGKRARRYYALARKQHGDRASRRHTGKRSHLYGRTGDKHPGWGREASPEQRAALSARVRAHWSDPALRAQKAAATRLQWSDPAYRARIKQGYAYWMRTNPNGNPRHPGTFGFRSMEIIISNPGLTRDEFISQGGRYKDLRWDLARGHVLIDAEGRIWPTLGRPGDRGQAPSPPLSKDHRRFPA